MKMNAKSVPMVFTAVASLLVLGISRPMPALAQNNNTMQREDHNDHDGYWKDENGAILPMPTPMGYPFAAPGGLDLFFWKDSRHDELASGSIMQARAAIREHNEMVESSHPWLYEPNQRLYGNHPAFWRDEAMRDPMAMSYPYAAPGSLNLFHWKSYAKDEFEYGTVADRRDENARERMRLDHEDIPMMSMQGRRSDGDGFRPYAESMQYPFAAPGSIDMFHWSDYRKDDLRWGSARDANFRNEDYNERHDRMLREHPSAMEDQSSDNDVTQR